MTELTPDLLERLRAVAAYANEIAGMANGHDQHTAVCVGVVAGVALGCRLGLAYPLVAREIAISLEGGMQVEGGPPVPTGLGEAAEELHRQIVDVIGDE
jgi:hypothetical protein